MRAERLANLEALSRQFAEYVAANGANPPVPDASSFCDALFLSHSSSTASFARISSSGFLRTAKWLDEQGVRKLRDECAEAVLGTAGCVFFYVAPFRYPNTSCGLLFSCHLESAYAEHGVATPFDSGGLVNKVQRADPDEDVCSFLARHELPVPDHRAYLRGSIRFLFGSAADYVHGRTPALASPIGLTGTDPRCWTHEVRIPESVPVRSVPYLEAVFVPRARATTPEIASLLEWCIREAKEVRTFDAPTGDDFRTLQQECIRYIEEKLY